MGVAIKATSSLMKQHILSSDRDKLAVLFYNTVQGPAIDIGAQFVIMIIQLSSQELCCRLEVFF